MNTFSKILSTGTLVLLASAAASLALDTDPGYGPGAPTAGVRGRSANRYAPQYFRPTLRYYGKGYTVTYRFIPWSDRMRGLNATSTWDIEQYRLPTSAASSSYANGSTPRITYFYKKPMSRSSTVPSLAPLQVDDTPTSGIATTPKPLPPIGEAPPAKP